ncbi:MAG: radical SAM protein [Clostridia bacterium]|nr:radical SAM protein [Clostridia bacterium]
MDEIKNENQSTNQSANEAGGQGGGRRRRRKRHKNGNHQNAAPAQATQQAQQAQQAQVVQQNAKKQNQNQNQNQNQSQNAKKQKPPKSNGGNNHSSSNNGNKQNEKSKRKDTYLYALDGNLYVNLTNKCSNGCDFCVRNERESYYGHYLWLQHGDPTAEKVMAVVTGGQAGNMSQYKEAVFCGFGEPTYKMSEMLHLCDFFHARGLKTRLNTNGQGNLINKRDITPDLKDKIDLVNISLNASCAEKYQPMCRSQFGESAFAAIIEFAKLCRKNGVNCRFSIVDCIGEEEIEACKRLAESVHVPLYIRKYITDSGE